MDKQNILTQEQENAKSTQNFLTPNQLSKKESDSNQNQNQLSSPKIIKEFDKKFCEKKNKESSLKVKEDIKDIQKSQIDQTDNKELEEKTNEIKSNQNSQIFKEEQEKVIKETQIQVNSHSIMKELHSDLTWKRKVLSQLRRGFIRNRQYQNVMVETYNIKDNLKSQTQNIHKDIPDLLQQQGYPQIQQEISQKQDQNQYDENSGKGTENLNNFNPVCNPNQYDQSQQDGNKYLNVDLQQSEGIYLKQDKLQEQQQYSNQQGQQNQNHFNQMVQDQKNENNSQIIQRQQLAQLSQNIQEPLKQESQIDNNTKSAHNTYDQQDQSKQDISNQQEIQNNSNQSQIQIKNNIEKQKELTERYAYQIKQMLDKIEEHQQQVVEINENQQEQEYFEKNNNNQVQSQTFQKQKSIIFKKLNENQFYLSKILDSNNNQTLILGFYKEQKDSIIEYLDEQQCPQQLLIPIILRDQQNNDWVCQIIHNHSNLEIVYLIFQTFFLKTEEDTQQNLLNQKYFNQNAPDQYNQLRNLKFTRNLELVGEYQFKEYLVQNKLDGNNITIDHVCKRLWGIMKFNAINQTEVSETFKNYQEVIISILENKKYYLCKLIISNYQEDVFIGYQEECQDSYSDYVFAIKYNPPSSEISKYLLIQCFYLTLLMDQRLF
ncbi:hypothetical protein ABPG72_014038 [Tetrahymena utriculariae]